MTLEAAKNIANTSYYMLDNMDMEEDLKEALPSLLNLLGLEYEEGKILYQNLLLDKDDSFFNKITPVELSREDIEKIEELLNSSSIFIIAPCLFPILDSIGWVVNSELGTFKIHFEGSNVYEMWNEPMMRWDDDIDDDEQCNWWEGDGWVDNLKFNEIDFDWKNSIKELENK